MAKLEEKEKALLHLRRFPAGLTTTELVRETGIEERTLRNYLNELWDEGKVEKAGKVWSAPDYRPVRLRAIDASPEEAMTVYLAARLFVKQHDKRNDSAHTILLKISDILTGEAGVGKEIYQAAQELARRPDDGHYNRVFSSVVRSYIYRRRLKIEYALARGEPFTTEFEPYLIEPSAIGFSTYVIGWSSLVKAIRTYKLERIRAVTLLTGPENAFVIPSDFPGLDILKNAWTIYHGEPTEQIVLRFSPGVRKRVSETRWHPSEDKADDPEKSGWIRWTAHIADITDILPWVRGWGADCEVIGPDSLRRKLEREVRQLARLYQVMAPTQPSSPHHLLWAKIDRKHPDQIHRLIYHLIDVGQCALALWGTALPNVLKQQIAAWLTVSEAEAGRLFAFWAALHDLGKASPVFQWHSSLSDSQRDQIKQELAQAGFKFPSKLPTTEAHHATISTWALQRENLLPPQLSPELVKQFALAIGGHHGAWPLSNNLIHMDSDNSGEILTGWREARQKLVEELLTVFQPPVIMRFELDTEPQNALLTLLSGVVAVSDWLGSDDKIFGYEDGMRATADYAAQAAQNARRALDINQWRALPELRPALDFATLFPGKTPRLTQAEALQAAAPLTLPALIILEAPMGSGKTEAALGMYAHWAHTAEAQGLYVAMPTMATSNQMHERVEAFLKQAYGTDVSTLLIHSRAALKDVLVDDTDQAGKGNAEQGERAAALTWFLPRKQSLLFPFGVGTVDQALMSVLQTKHFFVRLLGLSHKVIIFDEVHAYDTYMNTLFKRLLEWLRQMGASVIILSATLPNKTRRELAEAFGAPADSLLPQIYPRLTWAAHEQADSVPLPAPAEPRPLALEWMERDETAIIARLRAELVNGGCAAVICNTVGRAQKLYQALVEDNCKERWIENDDDLILFHARYPFAWRDKIEKKVLKNFGSPNEPDEDERRKRMRPHTAVVIATQVIEQSLDLDFDLMISDFAPTDLLLQRAGRLHRHQRRNRPPLPDRLIIAASAVENGVPQFDPADKLIYEHFVLLRSWLTVRRYGEIMTLPNDLTEAIEQTYDDAREFAEAKAAMREALEEAKEKMERDEAKAENEAHLRLVREPSFPRLLREPNTQLEEDNPDLHTAFQALTRLAESGITLVCVHDDFGTLYLEPGDRSTRIDPYHPDAETAKKLALYTVTVQDYRVVKYFSAAEQLSKTFPTTWQKIAALRYHRLAIFDNDGNFTMEGTPYTLRLTHELGLEIRKQEAA